MIQKKVSAKNFQAGLINTQKAPGKKFGWILNISGQSSVTALFELPHKKSARL